MNFNTNTGKTLLSDEKALNAASSIFITGMHSIAMIPSLGSMRCYLYKGVKLLFPQWIRDVELENGRTSCYRSLFLRPSRVPQEECEPELGV
ncbi:hypothetical protein I7I50_11932 [Histoplasma capsulatum G186AR]|uniref:Uncharacterized protein n=1 Tax=Ajellomyces capsulatus TaxID=5037 RepID=A0A8H7YDV9_AJECA|nr:hypothetical protein I7I52_11756 [Histoplasma capsulatum]QSS70337.1 hypothetical protein I7I50_11932 [Histoplasma capsulatum G186AR]